MWLPRKLINFQAKNKNGHFIENRKLVDGAPWKWSIGRNVVLFSMEFLTKNINRNDDNIRQWSHPLLSDASPTHRYTQTMHLPNSYERLTKANEPSLYVVVVVVGRHRRHRCACYSSSSSSVSVSMYVLCRCHCHRSMCVSAVICFSSLQSEATVIVWRIWWDLFISRNRIRIHSF